MKKASTVISAIIAIVVLLASLGVGFAVKRFRVQRAEKLVQAEPAPEKKQSGERAALPGRGERSRFAEPTAEQVKNMSEEERRQFMAERGSRFDAGDRQGGGGRRPGGMGVSEEERQAMREKYESMSEEEQAKFREEMRQRGGGRRRGDRGGGGIRPGGEEPIRRGEGGGRSEENQDNPPEN